MGDSIFQALVEAGPDAIVAVDHAGIIRLINAQTERLFGYPRDELLGRPVEVLVPEPVREVHPGHRAQYFRDPRTRPMGAGLALSGRRKDGTQFPVDIALSSIETEEGILVSAAVRDITDRIHAEREREIGRASCGYTDDVIIGKELQGTKLCWNTGAEYISVYPV